MSSNPLYGLRKVGTFVQLTVLPGRPVCQPVFAGCTRRLCNRWLCLVTKSTLEVTSYTTMRYTNWQPLPLPLSQRSTVVCGQLAHCCCLIAECLRVKPATLWSY